MTTLLQGVLASPQLLLPLLFLIENLSRHGFDRCGSIRNITLIVMLVEFRLFLASNSGELVRSGLILVGIISLHALLSLLKLELLIEGLAYTVVL